jgi:DNA/RNA-binding domain of Phe-tRNA-synthetase-like protein
MQLGCVSCTVVVEPSNEPLNKKMDHLLMTLGMTYDIQEISQLPAIFFARKAYRAFGKDPARYRLSAEALLRRVARGEDLYRINNVVDIVNMVALQSGISIGAYDSGLIDESISLELGKIDELYDAVGRGWLNIENLPVLKDRKGPFGSPTSDSVRTSVTMNTQKLLLVFFDFGTPEKLEHAMILACNLLRDYAGGTNFNQTTNKKHEARYRQVDPSIRRMEN